MILVLALKGNIYNKVYTLNKEDAFLAIVIVQSVRQDKNA